MKPPYWNLKSHKVTLEHSDEATLLKLKVTKDHTTVMKPLYWNLKSHEVTLDHSDEVTLLKHKVT